MKNLQIFNIKTLFKKKKSVDQFFKDKKNAM